LSHKILDTNEYAHSKTHDNISYKKGAAFFYHLETCINEFGVRQVLKNLLVKNAYGSVDAYSVI
jgi:hypothetical protein